MVLLAAGSVVLFALRKIGRKTAALLLAATVLLDLVPVDLRFLSHDNFVSPRRQQVTMTAADRAIRADETLSSTISSERQASACMNAARSAAMAAAVRSAHSKWMPRSM